MKCNNKSAVSLVALSVAGLLAMPAPVSAATLQASASVPVGSRVNYTVNGVSAYTGHIIMNRTGGDTTQAFFPTDADDGKIGDDIFAWCLQPNEFVSGNTWKVADLKDAPGPAGSPYPTAPMGVPGANAMERLVTALNPDLDGIINDIGDATVDTVANLLAGFQLAVWEVANERSGAYNVSSGDFLVNDGISSNSLPDGFTARAVALANLWLGLLPNWTDDEVTLKALVDPSPTVRTQDLLVRVPDPPTEIPLPAAGWLFGSALLGGLGLARRRKDKV
jgi:hypothetical protein